MTAGALTVRVVPTESEPVTFREEDPAAVPPKVIDPGTEREVLVVMATGALTASELLSVNGPPTFREEPPAVPP
jgi:hypothetical protein